MEYGEKIIALRKSRKMTQAELGTELNVTFQAVSKWERGESYPDFETLSRIARLFNVPISYFEEGEPVEIAAASAQAAPAVPAAATSAPAMLGVCISCGKVIYEGEGAQTSPVLMCAACCTARDKAEADKLAEFERREKAEVDSVKKIRNRGLIFGGLITAVVVAIMLFVMIKGGTSAGIIAGVTAVSLLFIYPFTAQLFWDGLIVDTCLCGGKIIGGPGVIFSLDLDGIIFLIVVKLLFLFIKIIFFVATLLFFVFIAIVMSPFTFVPCLIKLSRGIELG